jgi:DNA-binding transcriptional LysR family regulator
MGQLSHAALAATFVNVVEHGSFRAAARLLGQPKSTVSRHVAELEALLGARLLQRTTRSLQLTDAGAEYFRHAALAVSTLNDAERAVRDLEATPRGHLRVTAPVNFGTILLPELIPAFMTAYPQVEVTLDLTDRHVDLIEEGYDAALRAGHLPDSSLIAHRLGAGGFSTVASPTYLAAHGTPDVPAALSQHLCLVHGARRESKWPFRVDKATVEVEVKGRLACNSFLLLAIAAERGLGVARIPSALVRDPLAAGTLVAILEDYAPPVAPLHVLYPSSRHLSPKVRVFVDFVTDAFSKGL